MESNKPVEKPVEAGTQAGVENKGATSAPVAQEVDLLDEFQKVVVELDKKDAEIRKISGERDNYKKGLLRYKKNPDLEDNESVDPEEFERRAEERANQMYIERVHQENEKKAREIALTALKENRELKLALKSKNGTTNSLSVSSTNETTAPAQEYWSAEQIAYFKKIGVDPSKVKQNYLKIKT